MPAGIVEAPPPGALAAIIRLHADWYAREWRFGLPFEAKVARELGDFALSLPHPDSRLWVALDGAEAVGGIAIDGREPPHARLRWFIVAEASRGGLGRRLLRTALEFWGTRGFREVWLTSFAGLDAARRLYEAHGFVMEEEAPAASWGVTVREQRFRLKFGGI
jgi:GNAT superfamily N-acetyltransferase